MVIPLSDPPFDLGALYLILLLPKTFLDFDL